MIGDLALVLAISFLLPLNTQGEPHSASVLSPRKERQAQTGLLSFYTEMERQGKVFRKYNTTSPASEPHTAQSICMVSIMKDEELFIDEWIAYHLFIGIDYFFICDHSNNSFHTFLAPHINAGYLTVMPWFNLPPMKGVSDQCRCYELAFHLMNEGLHTEMVKCSWVTFLDCDEFITFRDRQGKGILKSFLSEVPRDVGSLQLVDSRFGHNGHFWDPPLESLVINSFTRRENGAEPRRLTKTISRVQAIRLPITSPHFLLLREGLRVQKADEKVLVNSHFVICAFHRFLHRTSRGKASGRTVPHKDYYVWRFVTSIVGLNNVEDRGLTAYADDIIDHLGRLGISGHNRTERLRPYQLFFEAVPTVKSGRWKGTKRFVNKYTFGKEEWSVPPRVEAKNRRSRRRHLGG